MLIYQVDVASEWCIPELIHLLWNDGYVKKETCCCYGKDGKITSHVWEGTERDCKQDTDPRPESIGLFHTHPEKELNGKDCEWFSGPDIVKAFKCGMETMLYNLKTGRLFKLTWKILKKEIKANMIVTIEDKLSIPDFALIDLKERYYASSIVEGFNSLPVS